MIVDAGEFVGRKAVTWCERREDAISCARRQGLDLSNQPPDHHAKNDDVEVGVAGEADDPREVLGLKVVFHSCFSLVRSATATGARPVMSRNGCSEAGEHSSPQGSGTSLPRARLGAGRFSPAGATPSASAMPRMVVGEGGGGTFKGLTPRRLHQVASEVRGDRAPTVRHPQPTRPSLRVVPSFGAIASRERCSGDQGACERFHQPLLSAGKVFPAAQSVIWQLTEDFQ